MSTISVAATALALSRRLLRPRLRLEGAVCLLVGGSRGLGLALARELAERGARLVLAARDAAELERARASLEERGAVVHVVACDVSREEEVERLVEEAASRWGHLEAVVTCAGLIQVGPLAAMDTGDYSASLATNFWGTVYPSLRALPHLRRAAGRTGHAALVHVTSIGGHLPVPHLAPYTAAKFAAVGFSESLRAELQGTGVRVTTVVPGLMNTGSPLHARFKGDVDGEYAWFAASGASALTAMTAERASRCIVRAMVRGEAVVTLGLLAKLARLAHGVAPGLVTDAAGLVGRLLPRARARTGAVPGLVVEERSRGPRPGRARLARAAARNNELPAGVTLGPR